MDVKLISKLTGDNIKMDKKLFTKMTFIYNAIQDGWTVNKKKDNYIFTRMIDGKKEVFSDDYLSNFIKSNLNIEPFNSGN